MIRLEGLKVQRLVRKASEPAWSPDGREIAFVRGAGAIYTVTVGSGRVRRLRFSLPQPQVRELGSEQVAPEGLAWSPTGRSITFSLQGRIFVVGANGGRARLLTDGGY